MHKGLGTNDAVTKEGLRPSWSYNCDQSGKTKTIFHQPGFHCNDGIFLTKLVGTLRGGGVWRRYNLGVDHMACLLSIYSVVLVSAHLCDTCL